MTSLTNRLQQTERSVLTGYRQDGQTCGAQRPLMARHAMYGSSIGIGTGGIKRSKADGKHYH